MANKKAKVTAKKRQATGAATATAMSTPNGTSDRYFFTRRRNQTIRLLIYLFRASQASGSGSKTPPQTPLPTTSPPPTPSPASEPQDHLTRAERTKEEGNVAFKTGKYQPAVDLYTKAIGKRPRIHKQAYIR